MRVCVYRYAIWLFPTKYSLFLSLSFCISASSFTPNAFMAKLLSVLFFSCQLFFFRDKISVCLCKIPTLPFFALGFSLSADGHSLLSVPWENPMLPNICYICPVLLELQTLTKVAFCLL